MNYYKTTNQPILSALLLMTLPPLILDLLHLVPLDILQLPTGTLYHSISPCHLVIVSPRLRIVFCYIWRVISSILLTYLLIYVYYSRSCVVREIPLYFA